MKFEELVLPSEFSAFLEEEGFRELYPPQEAAVKAGLLEGKNLVISSPTACYDGKTEVLTRTGWKLFRDTSQNEEVLSMNPQSFEMEYVKAEKRVEYFYRGVMVHVEGKEIDFRVTENHNMFVGRNHKLRMKEPSAPRFASRSGLRYDFLPAREISRNWKFKTNGIWKGRRKAYFQLPTMSVKGRYPPSKRPLPAIRIPMRDFLNFFGWYIAEGCTKFGNGNYEITLCQKKDPVRARAALLRLGLANVYASGPEHHQHFSISCPQLARYLVQFGKAFEKFVPDFIKELPSNEIRVFLESYSRGDGHHGRDGISPILNTTSRLLADDLQELLLKVGVSSSVRFKGVPAPHTMPAGHTITPKHPNYQVAGRRLSEHGIDYRKPCKPSFVITSGEQVYCLTLPKYHLLFVRRNGKALWCGNSGKTLIAMMAAYKKSEGGKEGGLSQPPAGARIGEVCRVQEAGAVRDKMRHSDGRLRRERGGPWKVRLSRAHQREVRLDSQARGELAPLCRSLCLRRDPSRGQRRQRADPRNDSDQGDPPWTGRAANLALRDDKQRGRDSRVAQVGPGRGRLETGAPQGGSVRLRKDHLPPRGRADHLEVEPGGARGRGHRLGQGRGPVADLRGNQAEGGQPGDQEFGADH